MIPHINLPFSRALAIETSGRSGSVALVEGESVLAEESFPHGLKHAAGLLPLIDRLLIQFGHTPANLQCLYVSEGPGSFTGLRIGITLTKTLSFATGAKIIPVPSLKVLAMNAPPEAKNVVVVLDAKRGQIFTARYERLEGTWIECEPAHLDSLDAMLTRSPRPVHLVGEGIPFHRQFLPADRDGIIITAQESWQARAAIVAQLGIQLARQNRFVTSDQFTPVYVRMPEAQEKYEKEHAKQSV